MIAFVVAGGLGLPDRDYYFKDDAKSKEIRDKYVQHVREMLALARERDPDGGARPSCASRPPSPSASLTRVEKRDPYKLYHRMCAPSSRR